MVLGIQLRAIKCTTATGRYAKISGISGPSGLLIKQAMQVASDCNC